MLCAKYDASLGFLLLETLHDPIRKPHGLGGDGPPSRDASG